MIIRPERLLLTSGDVINTINANSGKKIDLSFVQEPVNLKDLEGDFTLMKSRSLPLLKSVIAAVEYGSIIICKSPVNSSSVMFAFGLNKSSNVVDKVFVNIERISKITEVVNSKGEIREKVEIVGGYEELFNTLLAAYIGLKTNKVFNSPSVISALSDLYVDTIAQIVSRNFGNPVDGEKFRFITKYFFFDGQVKGTQLAETTRYGIDKFRPLEVKYPEFFEKKGLSLEDYIGIVSAEFPSLLRGNIDVKNLIIAAVTGLGDNGVYMLDNMAYFLSIVVSKARRSKLFKGYMLKSIESEAGKLMTTILQSLG